MSSSICLEIMASGRNPAVGSQVVSQSPNWLSIYQSFNLRSAAQYLGIKLDDVDI